MCNQNCNQGRNCTCGPGGHVTKTKSDREMIVVIVVAVLAFTLAPAIALFWG